MLIPLPAPRLDGGLSLAESIARRRSVREFRAETLDLDEISQLLWAAQGITDPETGRRAVPSAGALYPVEVYLTSAEGVDHYDPAEHALRRLQFGDVRSRLAEATPEQDFVAAAPMGMVLTASYDRMERRYGGWSRIFTDLEVGQVAQNVLLMAVALGLGAVPIGSIVDHAIGRLLDLPGDQVPVYVIAVGRVGNP